MAARQRHVQVVVASWQEFSLLAEKLDGFIYRGQADAEWGLSTALERTYKRFQPNANFPAMGERWALSEFRAKYHLHSQNAPDRHDYVEWLALLQHHGCPTRLLDFTYSLYIALHFAVSTASSDAAVWAVNHWAVRDSVHSRFKLRYPKGKTMKDTVNDFHVQLLNDLASGRGPDPVPLQVVPVMPKKLSARIARQHGLFLVQSTLGTVAEAVSFDDCLRNSFTTATPLEDPLPTISLGQLQASAAAYRDFAMVKVVVPRPTHESMLRHLTHSGISDETLFPDLDGLARSLVMKHMRQ